MVAGPKMSAFRNFLDAINSDGGHVLLACMWLGVAVILISGGFMDPGRDLFMAMLAILTYAMKGTGKANGKTESKVTTEETKTTETKE